jgi:hypothetical protein
MIWLASRTRRLITVIRHRVGDYPLHYYGDGGNYWLLGVKARVCNISQACRESRRIVLSRCTKLGCGGSVTFRTSALRREAFFGHFNWDSPEATRWNQISQRYPCLPICAVYIDYRLDTLAINWTYGATVEDITNALGMKAEIQSLAISFEYLQNRQPDLFFSAILLGFQV